MGIPESSIQELIRSQAEHDCSDQTPACVRLVAIADLPTRFGDFQVVAFHSPNDKKEHAALVHGDVIGKAEVPVRLHSECLTGDGFGSLRCDCRDQLELSMRQIASQELGLILYLRQEGRGIGFANKIRAYQLQEQGYDTIQANEILGFRPDERDYEIAAHMLSSLRVESIRLMSNNPAKIADLAYHGVKIVGRIPVEVPPNPYNARYLETKRLKAGHLLHPHAVVTEQVDSAYQNSSQPDAA
ncbi:MAG TPA: GTP cyclohydrolase II [Thermoplasmata archaeon]|nr:GTP cyclohydrolase II [Thermoplasmata archaeon]